MPENILIYEVKLSMRDAIYKGNIYQKLREIMDGHLSNLLRLFKNEKKQIHLLPISNRTLTLLRHVQIYISILRLK